MKKRLGVFYLLNLLIGAMFLTGCDQIQGAFQMPATKGSASFSGTRTQPQDAQTQGTVLAKINDKIITLEEFDEKIKAIESLSPEIKIDTLDEKKAYLSDLIAQELIYHEAQSRGIHKKKDVREAIQEFERSVIARQLILDETKGIVIEPAQVEAFFNQYQKEFATPEEIRLREIVVSSEAAAKSILISLLQGEDFAQMARTRSTASSAAQGGDLGFVDMGEQFGKLREVASTLDTGEVSQIFKGPDGYYIIKVQERKGGEIPKLTDVYDDIKNGLLQQEQAKRIQDLTDRLKRGATIHIEESLLR